jgi:hypothetical protein
VKTRFAYLIYAFRRLISNQAAINYLYVQKEGMSPKDWEVARCLVETMNDVVGSITMNQANGSTWLLSDAIVDFIHVYLQCSSSNDIPSEDCKSCSMKKATHQLERFVTKNPQSSM